MDILESLHSCFKINANEPPENADEIDILMAFSSIKIPEDYLSIIRKMTEVEILINGDKYIRIWSPSGCVEMNKEYRVQDYIAHSLAIGDDEGGSALILMTGKKGFGLYKVGFGDLDIDDAEFIAESIESLFVKGIGSEII